MLSLKCFSPFSRNWVRNSSRMTHFNTVALFHSWKGSAGRLCAEKVFKMLSEHYAAAIKTSRLCVCVCVCIVSYLSLSMCAMWVHLRSSLRHIYSTRPPLQCLSKGKVSLIVSRAATNTYFHYLFIWIGLIINSEKCSLAISQ